MRTAKVTLVTNSKNTFVLKDVEMLERMGYRVLMIYSPAHKDPLRFIANRIREFFLSLFYLPQSVACFSWFNDYHSSIPLVISSLFKRPFTLIVGGYDAISSPFLNYGIFLKKNSRQRMARWNYKNAQSIWVVHKSLGTGCPFVNSGNETQSGITQFIPNLTTPINEIPTAYDSSFWKRNQTKIPKTVLTVAIISDQRTFERKGIPLFLELATALPDFQFTVAGIEDISLFDYTLPKNVILLGKQTREALKDLYSSHTFYYQGSQIEGLPNVLCEAMLCECIPVGTQVFGIPDAIGSTGRIIDSRTTTENLLSFFKNPPLELGAKARKRIQEHYPLKRRRDAFERTLTKPTSYA
jgi:glycosyltransferase involved in cell wall biosynthesis